MYNSLLFLLYSYEMGSHTLREEHRLKVFENKKRSQGEYSVPRGIRMERALYHSPNILRLFIKSWRLRWASHVARMEDSRNTFKI